MDQLIRFEPISAEKVSGWRKLLYPGLTGIIQIAIEAKSGERVLYGTLQVHIYRGGRWDFGLGPFSPEVDGLTLGQMEKIARKPRQRQIIASFILKQFWGIS